MRAASVDIVRLLAERESEIDESERVRQHALAVAARARAIAERNAARVASINEIYRERLVGNRRRPGGKP